MIQLFFMCCVAQDVMEDFYRDAIPQVEKIELAAKRMKEVDLYENLQSSISMYISRSNQTEVIPASGNNIIVTPFTFLCLI